MGAPETPRFSCRDCAGVIHDQAAVGLFIRSLPAPVGGAGASLAFRGQFCCDMGRPDVGVVCLAAVLVWRLAKPTAPVSRIYRHRFAGLGAYTRIFTIPRTGRRDRRHAWPDWADVVGVVECASERRLQRLSVD